MEERRGKKKKIRLFQCLLLGTPGTQVGACALAGAVWHWRREQQGAGGYRMGTSTGIMYKGGCPPTQPPGGLDWLMGVGCIRGAAPLRVSLPDPWLRVPPRAWGWECRLAGPCTLEG